MEGSLQLLKVKNPVKKECERIFRDRQDYYPIHPSSIPCPRILKKLRKSTTLNPAVLGEIEKVFFFRTMEYLSPQRARPVRDADGLIWRSGAHLAASILFEDKKEFQSLDADTLIRRLLNGVKLHQHTPETAGAFARLVLSNSMARTHLGLKTAPFVGLVDDQFCQCALVAAGLLQLTQHPRLHRFLLDKIKERKGDE